MSNMSATIGQLSAALSKFQGITSTIPKKKTVRIKTKNDVEYHYKYADLADIWEVIKKDLATNELSVSQIFSSEGNKYFITTLLLHSSGEWIKSILELDNHDRIQDLGSEITYLRRYSLSSILGIVTDEDEDGKLANEAGRNKKKQIEPSEIESFNEKIHKPKDASKRRNPFLTEEEVNTILQLKKKINHEEFIQNMLTHLNVKEVTQIPYYSFTSVVNWLNKKIKQQEEAQSKVDENVPAEIA